MKVFIQTVTPFSDLQQRHQARSVTSLLCSRVSLPHGVGCRTSVQLNLCVRYNFNDTHLRLFLDDNIILA